MTSPTSPKRLLVMIRFLILGTVILLSTSDPDAQPTWVFWFVATLYLVSNFIYALESVDLFLSERISSWIFLFDVILVTVLIAHSTLDQGDFWIPYFLTILIAALAADLKVAIAAAVVSAAVYGFVLHRTQPDTLFSVRYFLHTGFYLATALFVSALAETAKRERTRRGGIEQALALSNRVADLFDLKRIIDLSKDPRGLARHILALSQELFSGDAGSLMLVDERSGELRVAVAQGLDPVEGRADPKGIASYIFRTGEALLLVGPPHADPRFSHLDARPEIRSSISVPIRYRDSVYGVLNFNRTNPHLPNFTDSDLDMATAFAVHVGVALANGRTFRELDEEHLLTLDNLAALQETRAEAIRTERQATLGEVVTSVARNLNDPLTGILGSAELAQERTPPGSEVHLALDAIVFDARRCVELVNQLQSVQRPPKLDRVPTDIVALVEDVLLEHDNSLKKSGIALVTDYSPGLHLVTVDRRTMTRVFAHLVENAATAMETRTDAIRKLTVSIHSGDGETQVAVADSGGGVRLDHIQSIFQPFFSATQGSAGLGLSTAQRLVRENGGHVRAYSDGIEGSTFVVTLPTLTAQEPRWGVDGKRAAPFAWPLGRRSPLSPDDETKKVESLLSPPPKLARLLLADASERVGQVISDALSQTHVVVQASTADRAMHLLRSAAESDSVDYSCILLDLSMAGGGLDLFERIREDFPDMLEHLVFASGAAPSEEEEKLIQSTGAPYLAKPFDLGDLRDAIQAVTQSE